jgi:hypothetical protein
MRQFVWGVICGALFMYLYTFYGPYLWQFNRYTDEWRNGAVKDVHGYSSGREGQGRK